MKKTNNFLNKNECGFYSNRSNINSSRFESYDDITKLNKTDYCKIFGMKNKDFTKNNNTSQEISDFTNLSSKIRLNKYQIPNKRGRSFYFNYNKNCNIFTSLIKANTEIKTDNNVLSDNENKIKNGFNISNIDKILNNKKNKSNKIKYVSY